MRLLVSMNWILIGGLTAQTTRARSAPSFPSPLSRLGRSGRTRGGYQDYSNNPYEDYSYLGQPDPLSNIPDDSYATPMQETIQDRVDNWRKYQSAHASQAQISARDEEGRVKLMTSVSKGSRALIFFVLMWRCTALYEIADKTRKGVARLVLVIPLALLFIGNMAGVVASVTSPSHSAKKRLKAILNLDKLVEALLIVYNFLRLTILPSMTTPRELYIASIMHSAFFILQCQAFTKLSWSEQGPTIQSYAQAAANEHYGSMNDRWTQPPPQQWQDERF